VLERPAEVVQPHTPLIPLYRPILERESGEHAKRRRVERCRPPISHHSQPHIPLSITVRHPFHTTTNAEPGLQLHALSSCSFLGILITKHIDRSGQITLARSSPTHYHPNERRASGSWSLEMANAVTGAVEQGGDNGTTPRRNTIK